MGLISAHATMSQTSTYMILVIAIDYWWMSGGHAEVFQLRCAHAKPLDVSLPSSLHHDSRERPINNNAAELNLCPFCHSHTQTVSNRTRTIARILSSVTSSLTHIIIAHNWRLESCLPHSQWFQGIIVLLSTDFRSLFI